MAGEDAERPSSPACDKPQIWHPARTCTALEERSISLVAPDETTSVVRDAGRRGRRRPTRLAA
jgi:hypothetical protein